MQGGEPLGARVAGLMPQGHNWACLAESSLGGSGGRSGWREWGAPYCFLWHLGWLDSLLPQTVRGRGFDGWVDPVIHSQTIYGHLLCPSVWICDGDPGSQYNRQNSCVLWQEKQGKQTNTKSRHIRGDVCCGAAQTGTCQGCQSSCGMEAKTHLSMEKPEPGGAAEGPAGAPSGGGRRPGSCMRALCHLLTSSWVSRVGGVIGVVGCLCWGSPESQLERLRVGEMHQAPV